MSADNGVYIHVSPRIGANGEIKVEYGFDYRIAHTTNIEDIYDEDIGNELTVLKFGDSKVYFNREDVLIAAGKIIDEIIESGMPLEYGIRKVTRDKPFPQIPMEEAQRKVDDFFHNLHLIKENQ